MKNIILTIVLLLVGCSLFESAPPRYSRGTRTPVAPPSPPKSVAIEERLPPGRTDIVITWSAPKESVDFYILRFGFSKENLNQTSRIEKAMIDSAHDDELGDVMRYSMKGIPGDKPLYISLIAVAGGVQSTPSEPFFIPPQPSARGFPSSISHPADEVENPPSAGE